MATVHALTSYPIKGCAGVVVERAEVTLAALAHDRLFAIVGPDRMTVWQGEAPRLARVRGRSGADLTALLVLSLSSLDDPDARIVERGRSRSDEPVPAEHRDQRLARAHRGPGGRMTIGGLGELASRCASPSSGLLEPENAAGTLMSEAHMVRAALSRTRWGTGSCPAAQGTVRDLGPRDPGVRPRTSRDPRLSQPVGRPGPASRTAAEHRLVRPRLGRREEIPPVPDEIASLMRDVDMAGKLVE
ncbi:MOSC N-terminal beta barrel domain-containing protein [Lentzea atacamensis]|uniref:MOSC N-terminal beta barrel domain-containing protein n=1 Tax=Lentzea atacamensis TaxID=531938 RepID=UPI002D786001|nr:MOSC N-terminal beta barrel domain-containing protein [Lentzea atacamensis]